MASIQDLKKQLQAESEKSDKLIDEKSSYEFEGKNIDELLEQASVFFDTTLINLNYEVIQNYSKGFLGFLKKPLKLLIWKTGDFKAESDKDNFNSKISDNKKKSFDSMDEMLVKSNLSLHGSAKVTIRKSGVYLKISPPKNNGNSVNISEVQRVLAERAVKTFKASEIKQIVKEAKNEYVKIADWQANPSYDSQASLEISPDRMKAFVTVTSPMLSGRRLEEEEIYDLLKSQEVIFGILESKIKGIFDGELYNVPILVAEGSEPKVGANATIDYKFKTNQFESVFEEDESGKIDYKNRDLVQNVVAGQILAVKNPPSKGSPGCNIMKESIQGHDGIDVSFTAGKNTILSESGLEIISQIAGKAFLKGDSINVDPIYEISGDIDLDIGNIIFLGTVVVKGNINDGFTVKAGGNIEVKGSIGNAVVESDNDVIVKKGIIGKHQGIVKAGRNVLAKFIGNAKISAGNDVLVKEEIVHSNVDAGGRVICYGKRAGIIGGIIRAGHEIHAKFLGATSYTDTVLEAGLDPKCKEKVILLEKELNFNKEQLSKIDININTLERIKESGKITKEKETMLIRLKRAKNELDLQIKEIIEDLEKLKEYLNQLTNEGKISAKVTVYPGVDLTIKDANLFVKNQFQGVTFVNERNFITPVAYQIIDKLSS